MVSHCSLVGLGFKGEFAAAQSISGAQGQTNLVAGSGAIYQNNIIIFCAPSPFGGITLLGNYSCYSFVVSR
jgi:hypothetical protein